LDTTPYEAEVTSLNLSLPLPLGRITYIHKKMNAEECDLPPFLLQLPIPIITNRGLNIYYIYMFATAVIS
jgi:hypothetical protein